MFTQQPVYAANWSCCQKFRPTVKLWVKRNYCGESNSVYFNPVWLIKDQKWNPNGVKTKRTFDSGFPSSFQYWFTDNSNKSPLHPKQRLPQSWCHSMLLDLMWSICVFCFLFQFFLSSESYSLPPILSQFELSFYFLKTKHCIESNFSTACLGLRDSCPWLIWS